MRCMWLRVCASSREKWTCFRPSMGCRDAVFGHSLSNTTGYVGDCWYFWLADKHTLQPERCVEVTRKCLLIISNCTAKLFGYSFVVHGVWYAAEKQLYSTISLCRAEVAHQRTIRRGREWLKCIIRNKRVEVYCKPVGKTLRQESQTALQRSDSNLD